MSCLENRQKKKKTKGEDLEQAEIQEEMIIDLVCDGLLHLNDKNELVYKLEDPTETVSEVIIPRPKGDLIMSGDRFKEEQTGHKAIAMIAAATGLAEKTVSKFEANTDIMNLMAVIGHFLTT